MLVGPEWLPSATVSIGCCSIIFVLHFVGLVLEQD